MRVPVSLVALSFLVVACGGGGDAAPADDAAAAPEAAPVQTASAGETTYQQVCITCHQADGKGLPPSFPPLSGSAIATAAAPEQAIAIVLHGMQGEIVREGVTYNGVMSAWSMLSDEQIAEVLTYARSNFGNSASAVTTEQVAAVRAATAGRAGAWTEAELMAAKLN
jgi:mono/diheme cytochrome c family protein